MFLKDYEILNSKGNMDDGFAYKLLLHMNSRSLSPEKVILKCDKCDSRIKFIDGVVPDVVVCPNCNNNVEIM